MVLLWAGSSIWRETALKRWQKIERSYISYYASKQGEDPSVVPPVRWDFERERLVEIPPGDYAVQKSGQGDSIDFAYGAILVKQNGADSPFWTLGIVLGQISALWFHGVFAGLTLLLAVIAVKWHL